ncbi:uncharacterized protein [Onthophagus taurus]|uniref:uncharacterized protein n=1 Tax=Onthophagus taurus TaxID=166361 RepID=UPI0039BDE042
MRLVWASFVIGVVGLLTSERAFVSGNPSPSQDAFITQTVYGFLDFTTTIGNTVMIFSPQSATPEGDTKPSQPAANVIDTKPTTLSKEIVIKPSKTVHKEIQIKSEVKEIISVVNTEPKKIIQSSVVEVKPIIASKVSVVNVEPITLSKVEVVSAKKEIISKVEVVSSSTKSPPIIVSKVEIIEDKPSIVSKVVEVQIDEEPAVIVGNNIGEPEYDFLSRQPSEVVEETYKVVNLKPSSKFRLKHRSTADAKAKPTKRVDSQHPTGLVTKLGGTVVKDGVTTVHETSVIGTYISGKYAQVLQSTSHVYNKHQKGKINPSSTLRILKTAAPSIGKSNKHNRHLEPTPSGSINEETALIEGPSGKGARKQGGSQFKRFKNKQREQEIEENEAQDLENHHKRNFKSRPTAQQSSRKQHTTLRPKKRGGNRSKQSKPSTVSVHSEQTTSPPSSSSKRYGSSRRSKAKVSTTQESSPSHSSSRRGYKPKAVQPTPAESSDQTTSLYKFKLNRSPGRWQYKTTAKPRVNIRKQSDDAEENNDASQQDSASANDVVTPQARSDDTEGLVGSESIATLIDDENSTENKLDSSHPLETIKVEISTPPDFKDIYYEIATIKSPYTFQVGSVKNTRFITVTSTFEKSLDRTESTISPTMTEPLTENILATSSNYAKDNNYLDSSVATLPHLYLASDMETPPLETVTETFSTTQTMLKTHILPVIKGGNETTSYTLVQTFHISRLVTATKTLPPMEAYQFIPSRTLNEFNSHLDEAGSELHLELEFGDDNDEEGDSRPKRIFPADLDLASIGSDISDLSEVDKSRILEGKRARKDHHQATTPRPVTEPPPPPGLSPEQLQQLAFLRLLNPAAAALPQGQVFTTSKPVLKVETVYESHVIPIVNGGNTIFTTLSKSLGLVTKTEYEYGTSTVSPLQNLPIPPVNPLFPVQQQQVGQFAVTSSPVVQSTTVTATESKVLKLTFGAKTAYTTIFSTKLVPTLLTTYMTASVPVQPTAAFPGYFPAPYPPFPYVG